MSEDKFITLTRYGEYGKRFSIRASCIARIEEDDDGDVILYDNHGIKVVVKESFDCVTEMLGD